MAKRRHVHGLPLIEPRLRRDHFDGEDCPRGGAHEDLPWVRELTLGDESGDKLIEFYCLRCHLVHWVVVPNKVDLPERRGVEDRGQGSGVGETRTLPARADEIPEMHDEHELFDEIPHA